jgi:hypothetical protein
MRSTLENRDWLTVPLGVLGLLLHLVVGVWLLVTRPLLALLVPVVALALYFAAIMLGGALFGWTA